MTRLPNEQSQRSVFKTIFLHEDIGTWADSVRKRPLSDPSADFNPTLEYKAFSL
jgi:hypothetical protein